MIILSKTFSREKFQAIFQAQEQEDGIRLDQFVMNYFTKWSRQMIKRKIDQGDIYIKERPGRNKPSTKIRINDEVYVESQFTEEAAEIWNGKEIPPDTKLPMVFEDEGLFVISKPAFMAVHPTGRHIFHVATVILEEKYNQSPLHSVHRLDRETSGLLLVARNPTAASELTKQFEKAQVKKVYFFISQTRQKHEEMSLVECNQRLGTEEEGLKRVYINAYPNDSTVGKSAHTDILILKQDSEYTIGLAFPQTGRQHQIRVHAQQIGLPLIGDKLYLGNYEMFQRFKDHYATEQDYIEMQLPRHALHAIGLKLNYKSKKQSFIAPMAPDLVDFISQKTQFSIKEIETLTQKEITNYLGKFD